MTHLLKNVERKFQKLVKKPCFSIKNLYNVDKRLTIESQVLVKILKNGLINTEPGTIANAIANFTLLLMVMFVEL